MKKKIRLKSKVSLALEPLDELQDITSTFFKFSFIFFIAAFTCRITNLCSICSVYVVSVHCTPPQTHSIQFRNVTVPNHVGHITTRRGRLCLPYFQETISILTSIRDLQQILFFLEFNPMWVIDTYVTQYNIWKFYLSYQLRFPTVAFVSVHIYIK